MSFLNHFGRLCLELPEKFHRWYGDQYSMAKAVHIASSNFGFLDPDRHITIAMSQLSPQQLSSLRGKKVQMITFKGSGGEIFMEPTLKNLRSLLFQSAIKK